MWTTLNIAFVVFWPESGQAFGRVQEIKRIYFLIRENIISGKQNFRQTPQRVCLKDSVKFVCLKPAPLLGLQANKKTCFCLRQIFALNPIAMRVSRQTDDFQKNDANRSVFASFFCLKPNTHAGFEANTLKMTQTEYFFTLFASFALGRPTHLPVVFQPETAKKCSLSCPAFSLTSLPILCVQ